ncbi:hypothetical protein HUG10_19850 (plasmid) [Halorarum halophilum]|uniref:Uncharacterized protein n=1 Tax=Halorarum halophilum TaxID=2743090 RepID=A0A7D5GEJ4_9EURY|nr:hypothetical protein [Halobaculum halophilum]QLG29866.1 hypothetical protein HUG10_19850 [Halobaculum halophilum]
MQDTGELAELGRVTVGIQTVHHTVQKRAQLQHHVTDPNTDSHIDFPIETKHQLEEALDTIIQSAYENGVNVNDMGYDLRHDDVERMDWEVRIVQLAKKSDNNK